MEEQEKIALQPRGMRFFVTGLLTGVLAATLVFGITFTVWRKANPTIDLSDGSAETTSADTSAADAKGAALNADSIYKIQSLEKAIEQNYYQADQITQDQKQNGLYKGLLESLNDPYSEYYTAEEVEALNQSLEGTYYGIGAYISMDEATGYPKISGVIKNTPAEAAGLMSNDIIFKVNDEDVAGQSLDEVVSKVRGEEGTTVHLTLVRATEPDYLEVDVERASVNSPTVSSQVMEDGIGYIDITEFDLVTTDQFKEELQSLYDQDIKGLILDLRDNPGGNVDVVTAIANELIPAGHVFYMIDNKGQETDFNADGEHQIQIPLVVLVNSNSASASEILSGAIQDSECGTIVGTQTYGKGVVQTVYSMPDGTAVKLTVADYYTRSGRSINKVGITPDVEVELDVKKYLEDRTDTQMEKALEILKEQL